MIDSNKRSSEIARLKKKLQSTGLEIHVANIAASYRMAGNRRRAFHWWKRAAGEPWKDGSALMELGYCYQYGIGVRRDADAACAAYRSAIRSKRIDEYSREEALYHLAIAHLDLDAAPRGRRRAAKLLREAASDGDYPQAAALLAHLETHEPLSVCRCGRGLGRKFGGKAQCPLHCGSSSS